MSSSDVDIIITITLLLFHLLDYVVLFQDASNVNLHVAVDSL